MEVTKKKEASRAGPGRQEAGDRSGIIEELMTGYQRPEDLTGPGGDHGGN